MAEKIKVACVGLNVVDCYEHQNKAYPGGNEFNVSIFARRLGAESAFIGCFGSDFYSGANYGIACSENVDLSHSRFYNDECGIAAVTLVNGDRVFIGGNHGGVTGRYPVCINEEDLSFLLKYDIVVSDRYSRMDSAEFKKIYDAGIPLAYDFGDEEVDRLAEAIFPYCRYAFFSCSHRGKEEILQLLKNACDLGASCCIATLGEKGAMAYMKEIGRPVSVAAREGTILDTMGAGDSFLAAFIVHVLREYKGNVGKKEELINCMESGVGFAAENCRFCGSIGLGLPYPIGNVKKSIQMK